jgi:hypothetical protein
MALRPRLSTGVLLSDDNPIQLYRFVVLRLRIPGKKAPITIFSYLNEKKHKEHGGIPYFFRRKARNFQIRKVYNGHRIAYPISHRERICCGFGSGRATSKPQNGLIGLSR